MISGRVNPDMAPIVAVELIAGDGGMYAVEMILDTGFNGDLSLPGELIRQLGFQLVNEFALNLADGREVSLIGWEGRVMWRGRPRTVLAVEAESEPLLGMNFLWRNRLTIDVHANGPVTIEELG